MKHFKLLTLACQMLVMLLAFELAAVAATGQMPPTPAVSTSPSLMAFYATTLGWVPAKNICGGYYLEPEIVRAYPNPLPAKEQATTITANQSSYFSQTGISILKGNVTVTQPGREITADIAHLHRNQQTGQLETIDLEGNVHFFEAGKVVVAKQAHIDLAKKEMTLGDVIYRLAREVKGEVLDAWGTSSQAHRESSGVLKLKEATYSTCPPTQRMWQVEAGRLNLDKHEGWGTAINSRLKVFGVPVAYFPYFTFPLDNRRKTGFLFPTYGYSNKSGVDLSFPYYLNLAPNYDATITPHVYGNRGLQYNLLYRYLTHRSSGDFNFSFLPSDRLFREFQANGPQMLQDVPGGNVYLSQLERDSDNRGFFSFTDSTIFNPHWSTNADLNYATDDYYFQDFGSTANMTTTDQLLNRGTLQYQNENWRFLGRLQAFQTLHPYTDQLVEDQYSRVPELNLSGDFPGEPGSLDYHLDTQAVRFDRRRDFFTGEPIVTGSRFNFQPSVRWPLEKYDGYIIPQLQLDATYYSLQNQLPFSPNTPNSINREIPIFDIDSGLFFDRDWHLWNHAVTQTLEPRVYYLYVPIVNQTNIPEFDTTLPALTVAQLFRPNRFVGIDRIGDANQVSLGLTSRLLDDYTNEEKAHVSVAEAFYLNQQHVFDNSEPVINPHVHDNNSPLVGELSYNLTEKLNITSDAAWDPNRNQINNGDLDLNFLPSSKTIFNIGYNFLRGGDVIKLNDPSSSQNNLNRFNIAAAIPLTERWSAVGNWNYNISHSYPQSYFYGLEYQSCCWAIRAIASRIITATNPLGNPQFENNYYVQLQLKGLGNVGNSDPSQLLASAIPDYEDSF
ncbi:MAG: LPS-assembly protein LptD [Gammaproteobacteria bacterium]